MIFRVNGDGQYSLAEPDSGLEFRADHLRRDHRSGELTGELTVAAGILGAKTIDGVLSVGSFNYSSVMARSQRAKILRERSRTNTKIDFLELLEAFCQHIARAERFGQPAVTLRDVPLRAVDPAFEVLGLRFPMNHLSIVFGAGDTLKSYLTLFLAGEIVAQGGRLLYVDWELEAEDHRRRLAAIHGDRMPEAIKYCKCDRPLVHEVDRLRRIIRHDGISYAVLDSVAYGTQGDPAEAAAAMEFCRAASQLGVGKIAIAHITKSGDTNDQMMPFGSVFWSNSARMTWNIQKSDASEDGDIVTLGCFNRKSNLGARRPAVGLRVLFDKDRVTFSRTDLATIDDMVEKLPLWQRIRRVVQSGPQTLATIASELKHENVDSLERIVRKHNDKFTRVTGGDGIQRIALLDQWAS